MIWRVRVVVLQQDGSISSAKLHRLQEQHNERVREGESADDERSSYGVCSDAGGNLQNDDGVYALRSLQKKQKKNS